MAEAADAAEKERLVREREHAQIARPARSAADDLECGRSFSWPDEAEDA